MPLLEFLPHESLDGQFNGPAIWGGSGVLFAHAALISWIDWRTLRIPNLLNSSLLVSGILYSWGHMARPYWQIILSVVSVYLIMALFVLSLNKVRGTIVMGGGDLKLFAASAAWLPIELFPWLVLMSSLSGLTAVVVASFFDRSMTRERRIAFGPFVSFALVTVWICQGFLNV